MTKETFEKAELLSARIKQLKAKLAIIEKNELATGVEYCGEFVSLSDELGRKVLEEHRGQLTRSLAEYESKLADL